MRSPRADTRSSASNRSCRSGSASISTAAMSGWRARRPIQTTRRRVRRRTARHARNRAPVCAAARSGELIREVPPHATARQVWDDLVLEWPPLREYEKTMSVAVNAEYARMTAEVHDGDEVAFMPPVSGGWAVGPA